MQVPNIHCNLCHRVMLIVVDQATKAPTPEGIGLWEQWGDHARPFLTFTRVPAEVMRANAHLCNTCVESLIELVASEGHRMKPEPAKIEG